MPTNYNTPYDQQFENSGLPITKDRVSLNLRNDPGDFLFKKPIGQTFETHGGFEKIDVGISTEDLQDIPEYRAEAQSGSELIGKALGQSVNEMVLGTLESAGYLSDLDGIQASLEGNEQEFDNWWSRFWRENKEHINEKYMPIYQTKAAMDGALLDRTALASGVKNLDRKSVV